MECHICKSGEIANSYEGQIRSGGVGSEYIDGYTVKKCHTCGVEFLYPFDEELLKHYDYESDDYWQDHQGLKSPDEIYAQHDPLQLTWLYKIGVNKFRNKRIADYGCGAGQFLDLLGGVANESVAVEPAEQLHGHLQRKGYSVFSYAGDLDDQSIDLGVSFNTAEHLEDPVSFFENVYQSLKKKGEFYVGVPNQNDFLLSVVPDFRPFYYRRSHLFYFTVNALKCALEEAGFEIIGHDYMHRWDLMNLIGWALNGEPGGHEMGQFFDDATERAFKQNIEREGISSHILVRACRSEN